jgi:hypothetical protein
VMDEGVMTIGQPPKNFCASTIFFVSSTSRVSSSFPGPGRPCGESLDVKAGQCAPQSIDQLVKSRALKRKMLFPPPAARPRRYLPAEGTVASRTPALCASAGYARPRRGCEPVSPSIASAR